MTPACLVTSGLLALALVTPPVRMTQPPEADDDAQAIVRSAVERLALADSYRWTTTATPADTHPLTTPGGLTHGVFVRPAGMLVSMPSEFGRLDFARRGDHTAVSLEGNWQTLEQAAARPAVPTAFGPPIAFDPNLVTGFSPPDQVVRTLIEQATDYQREGDTITARLNPDAVAALLDAAMPARLLRSRSELPPIQGAQGSVTFHLQGERLVGFSVDLVGSRRLRNVDLRLDRKSVTELADLNAAVLDLPPDAASILDALAAGRQPEVFVPEPGFRKLFDGRTLNGWAGKPGYWTVEDGAIVGRTTPDHPLSANTFLIAQAGGKPLTVDDFELRLRYRITADNDRGFANSGIQYRSVDKGDFVIAGYQADFEAGPAFSGILYDEADGAGGRGIMALRGESVRWGPGKTKEVIGSLGDSGEIQAAIKPDDWNQYVIIARGNRLQHFINGRPTIDVIDDDPAHRLHSGVLALQLHAGPPMTVRFKDIQLKPLSSAAESAIANVRIAPGFQIERIYDVPKATQGSWVALCVDPQGRLIAADQTGQLYRLRPPPPGRSDPVQPEPLTLELAGAHGLLCAFDSLYVMVNERGTHGLYRVRDTDGDDRYDQVQLLREIQGGGEHGMHSIVLSPDGTSLYVVCGNTAELTRIDASRVPLVWGEDNLASRIPTGFMDDSLAPQGWIARTDPDGQRWELIAAGLRNPFDIAFNTDGELFTYDADMEWDIGAPWYRPTRVNHVISGAEFGFRNGSAKWPAHYIDSFGAVVDIGPGSPTGITFGYGAHFPPKYRDALFLSDWSFGKVRAVHLKPQGATYTAEVEDFLSGQPLPVTDLVINPHDGAMYLAVGGRGAQSAVYRVTYVGGESAALADPPPDAGQAAERRAVRHRLEAFHGHPDPEAIATVWPYLADPDRAIRYAARTALEWQDPASWRDRALSETNPRIAIAALVALVRVSGRDPLHRSPSDPSPDPTLLPRLLQALEAIDWNRLSNPDRADLLRAYALAFIRLGRPDEAARSRLATRWEALFPTRVVELDQQLAELLVYLDAPQAAAKLVAAMQSAPTQEEQIHYALVLRNLKTGWTNDLRAAYFRWFNETASAYRGGNTFASSLKTIRDQAVANLSESEREALRPVLDAAPVRKSLRDLLAERPIVRTWTLDELVPIVERGLAEPRDRDRGRQLYATVACAACHRFGREGDGVGPDLTAVGGRFGVRDLLEAIVEPSKVISDQYGAVTIATRDGRIINGRVGNLFGDSLAVIEDMFDPGRSTMIRRSDIEEMKPSDISPMPQGLLDSLRADEIQDLIAYLLAGPDR
ncbi:MAG: hypothetical protein KatS3mg108_2331 [Isosphaeraceae bacterium]|jgi:putative heme-binding domain-containing protein|nr:MAG: hypothetical protein KatS3mg108_2331 [Isosphaeraceae bacterium]